MNNNEVKVKTLQNLQKTRNGQMSNVNSLDNDDLEKYLFRIRESIEMSKNIGNNIENGMKREMESLDQSMNSYYSSEDKYIETLLNKMDKEGTSFEEFKFCSDRVEGALHRKSLKDTEHAEVLSSQRKDMIKGCCMLFYIGCSFCFGKQLPALRL